MGAYRMRLPEELLQYRNLDEVEIETKASDVENAEAATRHYERCELYMELPASMDIESEKDEDSLANLYAQCLSKTSVYLQCLDWSEVISLPSMTIKHQVPSSKARCYYL